MKDKIKGTMLLILLCCFIAGVVWLSSQQRLIQVTHVIDDKYIEVRSVGWHSYTAYVFVDIDGKERTANRSLYVSKGIGDTFNTTEFRWSWEIKSGDNIISEGI